MIKRTIDIVFSTAALLLLLPFILAACLAVYAEDRRNPLYSHIRYGKDMNPFALFKIRTMNVPAPNDNRKIEDRQRDRRVTKIGKFLRAFHLDELPQLVNILKGDMSLVGPRPIPVIMKPAGILNWNERGVVRPGLTGLAQLYCTKYTSLVRKFHFDVLYVKKQSLWLDIKLVAATFKIIVPLVSFSLCTVGILLATLLPFTVSFPPSDTPMGMDKLAHFGMFTVMGVASVWFGREFLGYSGKLLLFILVWGVLLGAGTEFGQSLQPLREMSAFDFLADMVGTGYIIMLVWIARKKGLCRKAAS